ncbi:NUDIX domain-containing protein [Streptomyces sp. NPDC047841]|uniref:NUDIX hydrolase n=1 Tax=Streptomyces sp. NPDC047841 TaxID=3154708 RepID=UPI00345183F0
MPQDEAPASRPERRLAARVLLLDEADRLLLFAGRDDGDGHTFWYPAGGGCEAGETFEQAAVREIREETGLADVALGPEVWRRRAVASWGGRTYDCHERFFLARVDAFDVDTSGFTRDELDSVVGHRWWTQAELALTADRLVPGDLGPRLAELLASGPPERPIELDT